MAIIKAAAVLQHSYTLASCIVPLSNLISWYALGALSCPCTWEERVSNASASKVSRIRESAVNAWVKVIKNICQVKGQPEIIHPVKNQSKCLVSQSFDLGRRSEYMIYQSATPLYPSMAFIALVYNSGDQMC